jgi:hypothetical protein
MQNPPDNMPLSTAFKTDQLQFAVGLNSDTLQNLAIKITPEQGDRWPPEEINAIEQFFDRRVASFPPRPINVQAFLNMMSCPFRLLKDIIKIYRLEIMTAAAASAQPMSPNAPRWGVQWCLTIPTSAPPLVGPGNCAVVPNVTNINKLQYLFFVQFNRLHGVKGQASVVVPLLYDQSRNGLTMPEPKDTATQVHPTVHEMLKRWSALGLQREECILYLAVRDMMLNLNVGPTGVLEITPSMQQQQQQAQMQSMQQQPPPQQMQNMPQQQMMQQVPQQQMMQQQPQGMNMQPSMQGVPMQGGPMQGGPMQGGPMQGGPMQGLQGQQFQRNIRMPQ